MSNLPPDRERPDDADELYRRASARDTSQPSEAVRRAVLAHATRLGAQGAAAASRRSRARLPSLVAYLWQRPAVFGSLAAAVVAGLVIAPLWRELRPQATPAILTTSDLPATGAPSQEPLARFEVPPPAPAAPAAAQGPAGERAAVAQAQRAPRVSQTRVAGNRVPASRPPSEAAERAYQERAPASGAALAQAPRGDSMRPEASAGAAADTSAGPLVQEVVTTSSSVTAARRSAPAALAQTAVDPGQAFREAAERGDLTALEALRGKQTNIDARDAQGRTALMLAVEHDQSNAVSALLADGADPNATDARGTTPLQAATARAQSAIIASLRSYGAR